MAFLFRRLEQDLISSTTSAHSQRIEHHHIENMAAATFKIRTPEEAGMLPSMPHVMRPCLGFCAPPPEPTGGAR